MFRSCPLPANHSQHLINPAGVLSIARCCRNHYCPALFHVRGLFASSVMKPISLYLHPFASLITVLMNSLKELSYESLETQSDRYMGYLLTTGEEMKASVWHAQKFKDNKCFSLPSYSWNSGWSCLHAFVISWMKYSVLGPLIFADWLQFSTI